MMLDVASVAERVLSPGRFFVAPPNSLRIEHIADECIGWEVFRGHLVDPARGGELVRFEAWNVFVDGPQAPAPSPLLSLKWHGDQQTFYVTRQILVHAFEACEDTPGVILSRPVRKWVAELVATVATTRILTELVVASRTVSAVIGTSRLPITSLESPLPAFSLGELAYLPELPTGGEPRRDPIALLEQALAGGWKRIEQAKSLEIALRAAAAVDVPGVAQALNRYASHAERSANEIPALFRTVFNNVALSPYTQFADRMIGVLLELSSLQQPGTAAILDLFSYMLRHLARHLTAFNLTLFHNMGANYPDALFLDALLRAYTQLIERNSELLLSARDDSDATRHEKRLRRRALRAACLIRLQYTGHRVPDAPTSMGENLRVLPAPFVRVPEEQITGQGKRRRTLFDQQPLDAILGDAGRTAFRDAVSDLQSASELRELGMAVFLDRPLGIFHETGAVDRPLLAYEALEVSTAVLAGST